MLLINGFFISCSNNCLTVTEAIYAEYFFRVLLIAAVIIFHTLNSVSVRWGCFFVFVISFSLSEVYYGFDNDWCFSDFILFIS